MTASPADRRTTTASVLLLAGIAAVVSYRHMHVLALDHGEPAWTAALIPFSVDVAVAEPSLYGRLIAAWPSFALIGAYELLMRQIRHAATAGETDPARSLTWPQRATGRLQAPAESGQADRPVRRVELQRTNRTTTGNRAKEPGRDLVAEALRLNAEHWSRHRRPVSAEVLRNRLRIGAARARELKDHVRAVQALTDTTPPATAPT